LPPDTLRFLSTEWLAALGELVPAPAADAPAGDAPAGDAPAGDAEQGGGSGSLALGQIVEDAPGGDVAYTIHLGVAPADSRRLVEGSVADAQVVLVESYATARGLASGDLSPSDAIRGGKVKVRGAARLLATNQDLLVGLAEALGDLRSRTTF
jgi:hypothetical protein